MTARDIKVLLVDHQALFRESLGVTLNGEFDMQVVGCVGFGAEAVSIAESVEPHVIILDADRPEEVMEAFALLRDASSDSRFLVLSSQDHPALLQELLQCGISGFLAKAVTVLELVSAIRAVIARDGCVVLSVARSSITRLGRTEGGGELSEREEDVIKRISDGLTNSQIASRLSISEGTVKRHVHSIFGKLGAVSRIDAVNKYSRLHLSATRS
ncbi:MULTISPECIES: response regulator transcription factor [unclassified Streptomyces]|uniref:response regulator transcription factor n=1 Tax=unclassified Streptomyces TaxID=2593676 RepID=UPI002E2C2160|nr:response regulator transcription factor [Streptomyces sp. NBC_00273]